MQSEPTLLRVLLTTKHWQRWPTFEVQFQRAATTLADQEGEPQLARTAVSERQFERWHSGKLRTMPRPDACRVLEFMFGHPVEDLLAPAGHAPPAAEKGGTPYQDRPAGPEDPERTLAMAASRAMRFSTSAGASNVNADSLDQLFGEAARLIAVYPQQPLTIILGDVASLQDQTMTLLEGKQRPVQARDLYLIAGLASGMLAKASHDLRDPHIAMTHARTALLCARNSEHPALHAWVRGLESLIAYWAGRPNEALQFALRGQEISGLSGSVRVWLAALAARAWSTLGNATEAGNAVDRAAALREQVEPDDLDGMGGMCHFSQARELYYAADAGAMLTDASAQLATRTAALATEAISLYERGPAAGRSFGDEAGAASDLAIARIRAGQLDGAAEALRPVLGLPSPLRIHGVLASVAIVHQALRPTGATAAKAAVARDLQEEIEAFSRTPAAALGR